MEIVWQTPANPPEGQDFNSKNSANSSATTMDSQREEEQQGQSPSIEDCLKLLKGERDEQRLAGLLLVTKFCKGDDFDLLRRVYDAVGPLFLDRLLRTGIGRASSSGGGGGVDNRDAYLQLSVILLAALCRVPEIACSEEMVLKIPLLLEVMSGLRSNTSVLEECYEFIYLVVASSEHGAEKLCESGGMNVLASQMCILPDGSRIVELAIKVVQLMVSKMSQDYVARSNPVDLSKMVASIARQFAVVQSSLKFEALHLLSDIFASKPPESFCDALRIMEGSKWTEYMRVGVVAILQNRVAPAEKLRALILAESMVSTFGEEWLIGQASLAGIQESMPPDRCLLLVLETSRVEIAVLLNELAYLKYEASQNASTTAENIILKQRDLATAFSLVERIIKLISEKGEIISESTSIKVINGLNETVNVVLEYLHDAKEHGRKKGHDLLASVRVVGSYLAESPNACTENVNGLLDFMLSIEGEDEPSPFYSICFLLPMLSQVTMKVPGCKMLVSAGSHKAVVNCLVKLIMQSDSTVEDRGCIFFACDSIMNLLLQKEQVQFPIEDSIFIDLLKALAYWAENADDISIITMASSICSLILGYTSEDALLSHPNFDANSLDRLSQIIARSLAFYTQGLSDKVGPEMDLLEIISSGYSQWVDRFPHIKEAVQRK